MAKLWGLLAAKIFLLLCLIKDVIALSSTVMVEYISITACYPQTELDRQVLSFSLTLHH